MDDNEQRGWVLELKAARLRKRLSQRDLSRKTGIPQGHISKIENGLVDPQISSLVQLARALDLEWMLVPRKLLGMVQAVKQLPAQGFGQGVSRAYALEEESHD